MKNIMYFLLYGLIILSIFIASFLYLRHIFNKETFIVDKPATNTYFPIIMLVLASHQNALVRNCRKIWQHYMYLNPNIKVFMVYGSSANFPAEEYDLIYHDIEENYEPGMLRKTIAAIEDIDKIYTYDYLIRTNISTFWDFNVLIEHIKELPKTLCYSGHGPFRDSYLSGVDTIVNRHMIKELIAHKDELHYDYSEDHAMGDFFHHKLGAPFLPARIFFLGGAHDEGITLTSTEPSIIQKEIAYGMQDNIYKGEFQHSVIPYKGKADHYRVKNINNRNVYDMACYIHLCSMIYNIDCNIDFEEVGYVYTKK